MPPFLLMAAAALVALRTAAAAESSERLCTPEREGEVACLDGKLCACRHHPGGLLTGRPAGTRWDCGALRPACGAPTPAEAGPPGAERAPPLPPFLPMPFPAPEGR